MQLALSVIYRNLSTSPEDTYASLAERYRLDYEEAMSTQMIHYDDTMDGMANEPVKDLSNVTINRS